MGVATDRPGRDDRVPGRIGRRTEAGSGAIGVDGRTDDRGDRRGARLAAEMERGEGGGIGKVEATGIAGRERAGPDQPRGQVEAQEIEVAHPGFIVFFDFAGVPLDRTQRRAEGAMPRADLEHERPGRRRVSGRCRLEGHRTPYRGGLGGRPPALAREDDEDCHPGHRHRMDRNYRGGGDPIRRWTCALDLEFYQNRTHGANQDYFRRRCFLQ